MRLCSTEVQTGKIRIYKWIEFQNFKGKGRWSLYISLNVNTC